MKRGLVLIPVRLRVRCGFALPTVRRAPYNLTGVEWYVRHTLHPTVKWPRAPEVAVTMPPANNEACKAPWAATHCFAKNWTLREGTHQSHSPPRPIEDSRLSPKDVDAVQHRDFRRKGARALTDKNA